MAAMQFPPQTIDAPRNTRFAPARWGRSRTDFGRLWTALRVSLAGSQATALASPLIAAKTPGVPALETGALAGSAQAPFLLFSPPAFRATCGPGHPRQPQTRGAAAPENKRHMK